MYQHRLQELDKKMSSSTVHGLAPSTQCNFKTHVTTYVNFCTFYGLDMFPADVLQECRYLQYLSELHESVNSSKSYIGGMRSLHEIFGFKPPSAEDYMYQLMVRGIRRIKCHVVRQALPMTSEILAGMAELVDIFDGAQLAAWVAILTGFHVLFRKSNLVPDSVATFDGTKQLTRRNLVHMKDCYIARAYWAKNIQFHDKCLEIPMLPNIDWRVCPVFWLDLMLANVPAQPGKPAFSISMQGVNESLTYPPLTYWLREWVGRLGHQGALYLSHSLRRGGAQRAAQSGISHHVIKLMGDWKSQAYERYISMTLQERYDVMLVFNMAMN